MNKIDIIPLVEGGVTYVGKKGGTLDRKPYPENPRLKIHTIPNPSISDEHARFRLFRDECGKKWVRIVDTDSQFGTLVRNYPVNGGAIVPLDCDDVTLSNSKIRFVENTGLDLPIEDKFNVKKLKAIIPTNRGNLSFFHSLHLQFELGKIYALLGPSGCGKTTLLEILAGFRQPHRGDIYIGKKNDYHKVESARDRLGYAPQVAGNTLGFAPELTPRTALYYAHTFRYPEATSRREEAIEDTLSILGLQECAETPIAYLSGGQKNRINLGIELISRPQFVFLDEPTSGLSSSDALRLVQELLTIAQVRRISIILSAHQPTQDLFSLFDHVVFFAPTGYIVYQGEPLFSAKYWKKVLNRIASQSKKEEEKRTPFYKPLDRLMRKRHLMVPTYSQDGEKRILRAVGFASPSDLGLGIISLGEEVTQKSESKRKKFSKRYWKWLSNYFVKESAATDEFQTVSSRSFSLKEEKSPPRRFGTFWKLLQREMVLSFRLRPLEVLWAIFSALIIAAVISYVYICRGSDQPSQAALRVQGALGLSSLAAFWFGITLSSRSLVHEQHILRREFLSGYRITLRGILASKSIVLTLTGAIQVAILVVLVYAGSDFFFGRSFTSETAPNFVKPDQIYDTPIREKRESTIEQPVSTIPVCKKVAQFTGSLGAREVELWRQGSMFKVILSDGPGIILIFFILVLTCVVGIGQGLLISAFFLDFRRVIPREREAILFTPVALIPQILFGGIARRLQDLSYDILHYIMPERWAYELLIIITSLVRPLAGFLPQDRPASLLLTINTDINNLNSHLDAFRYAHFLPAIGILLLWVGGSYFGALFLVKHRFRQFQQPLIGKRRNPT